METIIALAAIVAVVAIVAIVFGRPFTSHVKDGEVNMSFGGSDGQAPPKGGRLT